MIQFKSKAEMAEFFGIPEDALVEMKPGEKLAYAPKTPLPKLTRAHQDSNLKPAD